MSITEDQTIWFPGIYNGREGDYAEIVDTLPRERVVELVQTRAKEDGEWAIDNGFVGDNEDKMRTMMAFVSDETNILQCIDYGNNSHETVDWICRDLANASKWVHGSRG